jgi:hypothetical protein
MAWNRKHFEKVTGQTLTAESDLHPKTKKPPPKKTKEK